MKSIWKEHVTLVFVGGCERSGTTWIATQLANSNNAIVVPESPQLYEALMIERMSGVDNGLQYFLSSKRINLWGLDNEDTDLLKGADSVGDAFLKLIELWCDRILDIAVPSFIVESSPISISTCNLTSSIFANTYYVNVVRDGREIMKSFKKLDWGPKGCRKAAFHWASKVGMADSALNLLSEKIRVTVKYENFLNNDQLAFSELKKIIGLSQLAKDTGSEHITKYTKAQHLNASTSSVVPTHKNVNKYDIAIYENIAWPLLVRYNYELQYPLDFRIPFYYKIYDRLLSEFIEISCYFKYSLRLRLLSK